MKTASVIFIVFLAIQCNFAQFPDLANELFGPKSTIQGVKKLMGGILGADAVHSKCLQKTLCSAVSDEIVERTLVPDPVKRTLVYSTRVIQPKGSLRWIVDIIFDGVSRVARKIGLVPSPALERRLGKLTISNEHWYSKGVKKLKESWRHDGLFGTIGLIGRSMWNEVPLERWSG